MRSKIDILKEATEKEIAKLTAERDALNLRIAEQERTLISIEELRPTKKRAKK